MKTTVHWLLTGTGDIATKRVAPALVETAGSRLHAVCDLSAERAHELASKYSVEKIYTDFEDALNDPGIDTVYVATPVNLHVPMALKALESGKHVLVEKPLGVTIEDAGKAVEAESLCSLVSCCAYFRRFYPGYTMLKEIPLQLSKWIKISPNERNWSKN